MMELAGTTNAAANASAIMKIETDLAKASRKLEETRDPVKNYNKMSIAKLNATTKNINWNKLLDIANNYIFSTIYMSSVSRSKWQNETQINFFDYFKHPHNYTHTKPNPISMKFGNIVDIFYNPGHERKVYGMYLMAAPEMWFGQNALVYFEKQKLLSFPDVIENKELENGTIYIKLFDNVQIKILIN